MTFNHYLQHRRRYEFIVITIVLLLVAAVNATSQGIEIIQDGHTPAWIAIWTAELTAAGAVGLLLPFVFRYLAWLDLGLANFRWRALGLVPGYLVFSLAHIGFFVVARKVLWSLAGASYTLDGPIWLGLLYEMRKNFLAFMAIVVVFYGYRFILDRLRGEARFLSQENNGMAETYRSQFLVRMLDREYLVRVGEIDWIQSAGNYVLLHCGERQYPMRQTLKSLMDSLDPALFQRVHRTAIVNLGKVATLRDKGDLQVTLQSGVIVPLSRTYLAALRGALSENGKAIAG